MPSLLGFLGFSEEMPANLLGKDLSHVWEGGAQTERDMVVVYDEYGPVRMIRDTRYKYVQRYPDGPNEFFDLVNDPDENHNIIDDDASQQEIRHYAGQLKDWFHQYVNLSKDGSALPVTGMGQLDICTKEDSFHPC
jgi:arylsulfatase A-like enzyme